MSYYMLEMKLSYIILSLKNMGTEELLIFTINKFIDEDIHGIKLKANFLSNSPNE